MQGFGSQLIGDKMSDNILKDGDKVRSLTESVNRLDQKLIFEL